MFKIIDKSKEHLFNEFKDLVNNFMHYAIKRLKITEPIRIYLTSDLKNAKNPLGKTAYYDDRNRVIILFTDNQIFVPRISSPCAGL